MDLQNHAHRRRNILTGDWVLVSPHRTKRPWQGKKEQAVPDNRPAHDPSCYLCPGNERAGGVRNPPYKDPYVFTNDFSAMLPDSPSGRYEESGLLIAEGEQGTCRVICFSPRHDLTLARMQTADIVKVITAWKAEYTSLGILDYISHVQIFENKGQIMGCSNPHPHGQIWADRNIPDIPLKEGRKQISHIEQTGSCLICEYLALEIELRDRIVIDNDTFAVLVPFWAVWPFEIIVLPKIHATCLLDLPSGADADLADIIRRICIRYDNLFAASFPYSMGIHQKPTDGEEHTEWHMHLHFYPPLLRSATVKKFMVGYEMLAMPQRDITAEGSAQRLRELPEAHYSVQ